jgi:hypothetical protein
MTAKVYTNVLSRDEIESIIKFYESKDVVAEDYYSKNKNLEYQFTNDFSYQLLHPKITAMLGEHDFATGAHKECIKPYDLHVDAYEAHEDAGTITSFITEKNHNCALLIPLVEGLSYKTVTFSCYSKSNNLPLHQWAQEKNSLDVAEFTHCDPRIGCLPIDIEYTWRLGDILRWDRDQLHASADFTRHGVTKQFLILFIA